MLKDIYFIVLDVYLYQNGGRKVKSTENKGEERIYGPDL